MARVKVNSRDGLEKSHALWVASIFSITLLCCNKTSAQKKTAEIAPVALPVPQLVDITPSTGRDAAGAAVPPDAGSSLGPASGCGTLSGL